MKHKIIDKYILGRLDLWRSRLQGYLGLANFFMLLYLYVSNSPIGIKWYIWVVLLFIVCPFIIFFDMKYVYPYVLNYSFTKNTGFKKISNDLDDIKKFLEIKTGDKT